MKRPAFLLMLILLVSIFLFFLLNLGITVGKRYDL